MNVLDAAYKTVHNPKHGGSSGLAARLDMSKTVLNNKVNPNTDTHHLRLDEAMAIMQLTGDTSIIEAMASDLGGVFTLLDSDHSEQNLVVKIFSMTSCHGDLAGEFKQAMADGRINQKECNAIKSKANELQILLQSFVQMIEAIAD